MERLRADKLIGLRKQQFENFCRRLLEQEKKHCFDRHDVRLIGPAPEDNADGGRDLEAIVSRAPRRRGCVDLLPQEPQTRWYSCKTHSTKREGWRAQARKDVDPPGTFDAQTGRFKENAQELASKGKPPPLRLLQMLANGGTYWILLNVQGSRIPEFEEEIATRLRFWIEHELERSVDLDGRIRVQDANELANIFNERPWSLDNDERECLGLDAPPDFLWSWEQWNQQIPQDRQPVGFESDPARQALIESLGEYLDPRAPTEARVFRIAGAPGVGKTRLVHHVFEQRNDLHGRICYTTAFEEAQRWLRGAQAERNPDLILVVDEVPARWVHAFTDGFRLRAEDGARLLLVGPRDDTVQTEPKPWLLEPMASDSMQRLIAREIEEAGASGRAQPISTIVTRLCEGYPLFAMWLTRALARDPSLLADPRGELTGRDDPWRATAAVLAGSPAELGCDERAWYDEAELRAKALLLATLVPDRTFDLDTTQRTAILAALEVDRWHRLRKAARACADRGLLRDEPPGHHYISPANLERLVLNHLFGPRGLDPEPLRKTLKEGYTRLLERARAVRVSDSCRQRLADAVLEPLASLTLDDMPRVNALLSMTRGAAFLDPERMAFAMDTFVARIGAKMVADDPSVATPVVDALGSLHHHRLSTEAFVALERALFVVALEQSPHPLGVDARIFWPRLFAPWGNRSARPFEERWALLVARLDRDDARARRVALIGLCYVATFDRPELREDLDTRAQVVARQRSSWTLIATLCSDEDPDVAAAARDQVIRYLPAGLGWSGWDDLLTILPEGVQRWSPVERRRLRGELDWRIDLMHWGPEKSHQMALLEDLREALRPNNLEERLVARVGTSPAEQRTLSLPTPAQTQREFRADQALAREFLATPETLRAWLAWLGTDDAPRAGDFGRALGVEDEERTLLPLLVDAQVVLRSLDALLIGYLRGWSEGIEDPTDLDAWLETHAEQDGMANVVAAAVVALGGSDRRARLMMTLVEQGGLEPRALLGLGFWSWHEGVSLLVLDALILALAERSERHYQTQALGLLTRRVERSPGSLGPPLRAVVHDILRTTSTDQIAAVVERDWVELAARWRVEDPAVVSTVLELLRQPGVYLRHARQVLDRWIDGDAAMIWQEVTRTTLIAAEDPLDDVLGEQNLTGRVPASVVSRWVGEDLMRAVRAARWSSPRTDSLDPSLRTLLVRFGAQSSFGELLREQAITEHGGSSPSWFHEQQRDRAAQWARDPEPEVAIWADSVHDALCDQLGRARSFA